MNSYVKLFALSLLLSSSSALLPQPSSALLAADTLRNRGYSIFASLLASIPSTTNFSGTLLAPPDFAFSFASNRIIGRHRRPPPRPSIPLLLYHTLRPPLILNWPTLSDRHDGDELRSFYNNFCLHLFKNSYAGEVSISPTPFKNHLTAVKIRQPDLFVDDSLTVHGIDGVLNPLMGVRCSVTYRDPTADAAVPLQVHHVFLDNAVRALRRKGYHTVATAMSIRRADLLPLTSVTVFAVSDEHLFMTPGGLLYDFRHHVVPERQRLFDLAKLTEGRPTEFLTLAPNKTVNVVSDDGAVSVDGVPVGVREVYHNRWMVVVSVISSLDVVADSPPSPALIHSVYSRKSPTIPIHPKSQRAPAPSPLSGIFARLKSERVPSPSPAPYSGNINWSPSTAPKAAECLIESDWVGSPSPAAEDNGGRYGSSPSPSPSLAEVISEGVEGGDLLCPDREARERETRRLSGDSVEEYHVNIADDVFFYT